MSRLGVPPGTSVFVVDDDKNVADTLSLILQTIGFSVATFYDGSSAIKEAQQNPPDILLSDVMMPGMDGITLANKLQKQIPDCRILLISGNAAGPVLRDQCHERGEQKFEMIEKPVHPMVLIQKLMAVASVGEDAIARLASIVDSSEDAIMGKTLDGVITDWNGGATRLYGYTAEEAIGKHVSMLVPSDRGQEIPDILARIVAGERVPRFRTVRLRKDGILIHVSSNISPILSKNGRVIGASNISHDISDRTRTEESLRRSEERFRLVARATNDALFDYDVESGTVWWSDNYWTRFGYSSEANKFDIEDWKELIHPEDRDRVWSGLQTAMLRQCDFSKVEYRFRRADDSYAKVLGSTYIAFDETGRPIRAVGAVIDLSERRELEEQFRQAQKMEAVGRLAGGVAHDFNNLLMVITAYTEIMREKLSPEDGLRDHLDEVQKAAERGGSLTHQLLAFSRKQVLLPRIIDLSSVVEESLKMIQRLIGEDIELEVSTGDALWAVKADPGQIVQVLMNLCINARDAMRYGGELRIETRNIAIDVDAATKYPAAVPGDYVALVVNDSGTGMTKETQAQVFEPFFTTKELGRGTGLGLSTVFGIVKQSGGYVWVDSELGHGSTFTIFLPAVDAPLTTIITPKINKTEGQGETVLLVEDDEALRESISAYLNLHGYKVLEAVDGAEALQIARQHADSIQVLVTDMIMPKLSGAELAREVAKISQKAVTLYMSGYTDRELIDYDPATSTVGFLQKPFALRTLLEKLGQMIAGRG